MCQLLFLFIKGNGYIESLLNKIEKNYQESQKEIEVIFVNDYPDEEIIVR